jgi:mannose-6-phosphate isomerase-like protein (cupin superfamily)
MKGITMSYRRITFGIALVIAFSAGVAMPPLVHHVVAHAEAAAPPLAPSVIDLAAIKHDDLPKTSNPEMNTRMLVVTDNATVQLQSGNVKKHIHPKTDEIQYIIEGTGAMWLGNERKEFKPGTIIIIPKGTAHAGALVTSGPVKALAIKIPAQPPDDTVFVD